MRVSVRLSRLAMLGLLVLSLTPLALCQNCALCYTQAAASGSRMIEAIRSGILILIVPPTLMSVGVVFVAYAKRNKFRNADGGADDVIGSAASDVLP